MSELFHSHIPNVLFEGKLPEEWMLSSLIPIFQKGGSFSPNL